MDRIARAFERGTFEGRVARGLAMAWGLTAGRRVERALAWPSHVRCVAVGGATLGGSGKTPLAIACAAELAAAGARTILVGHAYRATPGRPRVVARHDRLSEVGDEALVAAGALDGVGASVVVAPTRAAALAFAGRHADTLILDGVAQTAPVRASLALLAIDADQPWGLAEALPPRGDLRAPQETLIRACDVVVPIHDGSASSWLSARRFRDRKRDVFPAHASSRGAWIDETMLLTWETLRRVRVGLLAALARPDRIVHFLARRGVHPKCFAFGPDHGPLPRFARTQAEDDSLDVWLASAKCARHLPERARAPSGKEGALVPVATLDYSLTLDPRLCARLHALVVP